MPALILTLAITSAPSAEVNKCHATWEPINQASVRLNAYLLVLVITLTKPGRQITFRVRLVRGKIKLSKASVSQLNGATSPMKPAK
jgi:hypothetical protein